MELTKNQIQQIDNRLKSGGIKYWDLRLEMIDHIATDLEQNSKRDDFNKELNNSLKRIGYFYKLSATNTQGWQNVNKFYRKKYLDNIKTYLKSPLILLLIALSIVINYFLFDYLPIKTFKLINFSGYIIVSIPFFILTTKLWFKKYGKSVHLDYGIFYFGFALIMLNLPLLISDYLDVFYQKIFLILLLPFFTLATFSGYQLFKESIEKIERIRKELNL
ncbi:MAG: hypothetical protein WAO74_12290 [Polaribacter sp.]|uniref:hypothetical protein n=1 Tax=Polaribacter sp. TaxID=1920175 RepID=UPI003BB10A8C